MKAEQNLAIDEEKKSASKEEVVEKVVVGASETRVYKFALPDALMALEVGSGEGPPTQPENVASSRGRPRRDARPENLPPHGPLVELDVTTTAPTTIDRLENATQTAAASLSETQEQHSEKETHTKWGLPWWLYVVGVGGLACASWLLWKGGWLAKWITL